MIENHIEFNNKYIRPPKLKPTGMPTVCVNSQERQGVEIKYPPPQERKKIGVLVVFQESIKDVLK